MDGELIPALAISLLATIILEFSFFLLTGKRDKKDLLLVLLVNVLTNPAVVLLYWLSALYTVLPDAPVKLILEVSAILLEGYYYSRYGREFRRPYLFSAAANGFSFGVGALIQLFM